MVLSTRVPDGLEDSVLLPDKRDICLKLTDNMVSLGHRSNMGEQANNISKVHIQGKLLGEGTK